MQPGEKNDDDCLHFIGLTKEYITDDMSKAYKKSVTRAAKLAPAEGAALLGGLRLASMIQGDQAKTLHLLEHSIIVSQHFAKQAANAKQAAK